jgi:hypothetical protein
VLSSCMALDFPMVIKITGSTDRQCKPAAPELCAKNVLNFYSIVVDFD